MNCSEFMGACRKEIFLFFCIVSGTALYASSPRLHTFILWRAFPARMYHSVRAGAAIACAKITVASATSERIAILNKNFYFSNFFKTPSA
jgi:hypothetical protein